MFNRAALPRVVPFAIYMVFIALADLLARIGYTPYQLRWLYPVKILAVVAALLVYRRHYVELARPRLSAVAWALALLTGVVVLLLWVRLDAGWMVVGTSVGYQPFSEGHFDWMLALLRLAGGMLVVPVMEELFWRSFLMRWMVAPDFTKVDPVEVKVLPFIVTVILFGAEHNLWFAGVIAGAAYSLLYMRSRSLWSPVVAHSVTNGLLGGWIIATENWTYW